MSLLPVRLTQLLSYKDLFEEMIPKTPLTVCFPEYTGEAGAVQPALVYIEKKYKDIMQEAVPGKPVYVSIIAARVRLDMKGALMFSSNHILIIFCCRHTK